MKLVVEKEQLLVTMQEELEKMKDKVLRTFAEMENVKDRTRRESENAKKFAIQVCEFVSFVYSICFHEDHCILLIFPLPL